MHLLGRFRNFFFSLWSLGQGRSWNVTVPSAADRSNPITLNFYPCGPFAEFKYAFNFCGASNQNPSNSVRPFGREILRTLSPSTRAYRRLLVIASENKSRRSGAAAASPRKIKSNWCIPRLRGTHGKVLFLSRRAGVGGGVFDYISTARFSERQLDGFLNIFLNLIVDGT